MKKPKDICKLCLKKTIAYNFEWDSYYCKSCLEWAEAKCAYDGCEYCKERPDKPTVKK